MTGTSKLFLRAAMAAIVVAATAAAWADEQVLYSGTWTKGGYEIAGEWSITQDDDRRFVELGEGFRTKRAPDLKIFLSPLPLEEIGDRNATDGSVLIAPLASHRGAQRYEIDEAVDPADYASIIIHCERFSKYWGGATLAPAE